MAEPAPGLYGPDLAHVHHTGYGGYAEGAAGGLLTYLRDAGIHRGLIVDLACGSGLWAARLLSEGYDVAGIDASPAMIELARRTAPGAHFTVASVHDIEIPPCVAVTCVGEGLSYLAPLQNSLDLRPLLARVHAALGPGGLLVFDVVEREGEPMAYASIRGREASISRALPMSVHLHPRGLPT